MAMEHLGHDFVVRAKCRNVINSERAAWASGPTPAALASKASNRSSAVGHGAPGCGAALQRPQKTNMQAPHLATWSSASSAMHGTRSPVPSASHRGQNTTSCMLSKHLRRLTSSHFFRASASCASRSRITPCSKGSRQSGTGQRRAPTSASAVYSEAICSKQPRQPKWPQSRKMPREPTTWSKHMGHSCTSRARRTSRSARA
mmetsp:Transcript_33214/g.96859  ORF Transcript_33214/g.96859 Transcript_33214/m.96859 type:complete len:202 (+) Transcript_33214:662-1267(+)